MSGEHATTPPRATRRQWLGLAVIALPCLLYSMDLTVLNLALPTLSADLAPTSLQLLWIVDIYGFLLAGSLITMGTIGDRIGRRRLLLCGAVAFGLASVLAAYSTTPGMLIASRAVLGVAGATLAPSTLSLIRTMFLDPRQRTTAIAVWATSFSVGAAIGPLLGGVLLERFWWGSVFLLAVPVMALLLALGPVLLPEYRDPAAGRPDLVSAALAPAAVLPVIYGLKQFAGHGASVPAVLCVVAGLAVGAVFLRRQRVLAVPMLDLGLFRTTTFSASLATSTLSFFVAFAALLLVAQHLQLVLGLSPLRAGLWTLPSAGGLVAGSMLVPVLVRLVRPASAIAAGLVLAAGGFVLLMQVDAAAGLPTVVAASVVVSLAIGAVGTIATDLIVGSAPPDRAGAASALSETSSEFGGAAGIAVLGSIATAVYRQRMAAAVPAELPGDAARAAGDTLAGALAAARQLPDDAAATLVTSARDAFVQGMHVSAAASVAVALAVAVLAAIVLRHARPGGEAAAPDEQPAPAEEPAPVDNALSR